MIDPLVDISRRLAILERQAKFSNRSITATVTNNEDPEHRNRIKVSCQELYGESGESPWLVSRASINGNNEGEVWTPKMGSQVSIALRDGNSDAGEYFGGPRDINNSIPTEFNDPNINGIKVDGIIVTYNGIDKSYSFETEGGKLVLNKDGSMDTYGIVLNVHSSCNLNSDNPLFGVITSSPLGACPLFGNHRGSLSVKASD